MVFVGSNYDIPSAMQLTPYEDRFNPLISYKEIPDLKKHLEVYGNIYYSKYNQPKKIQIYISTLVSIIRTMIFTNNRHFNKETGARRLPILM